jgi:hypothetical protein
MVAPSSEAGELNWTATIIPSAWHMFHVHNFNFPFQSQSYVVVVLLDVTRCYLAVAKKSWVIHNFVAWWPLTLSSVTITYVCILNPLWSAMQSHESIYWYPCRLGKGLPLNWTTTKARPVLYSHILPIQQRYPFFTPSITFSVIILAWNAYRTEILNFQQLYHPTTPIQRK